MQELSFSEAEQVNGAMSMENGALACIGIGVGVVGSPVLAAFALGCGVGLLYAHVMLETPVGPI